MKKIFLLVFILLKFIDLHGGSIKDNPDRYPSFGISYNNFRVERLYTYLNESFIKPNFMTKSQNRLVLLDLRLPIMSHITLNFGYGIISGFEKQYNSVPDYFEKVYYNGNLISFGVRFYFKGM